MEFDDDDEDIIYGITAPARNIPELALATQSLLIDIKRQKQVDENKIPDSQIINKHLDLYLKQNPLPQICLQDEDFEWFNVSRSLTSEDLNNHIVVLDFFTYCCINCLHILPDLKDLEEKYEPNNSPVLVVGIHSAKFDNERISRCVRDAIKKNDISHPVINDARCKLWNGLHISCWPTLLIVGPGGLPLFVLMGEGKKELLFKFVEETVNYFKNLGGLSPKTVPLEPHVHLPGLKSGLYYPGKVETFHQGLIISDSGNNRIVLTNNNGVVQDVIGSGRKGFEDGPYELASFNNPQGSAFHPCGAIFVADTDNHAIRKIDLKERLVVTVAGTGQQGKDNVGGCLWKEQCISSPWDVCLGHSVGISLNEEPNLLLIAMAGSHQIWGLFLSDGYWIKKSFYRAGTVIRLAGSGLEENRNTPYPIRAGFAQPSGISIFSTSEGEIAVIADSESSSIRQFSCIDGAVKKIAGGGTDPLDLFTFGDHDGLANVTLFQHPLGIATFDDKIYVADTYNHKIKVVTKRDKTFFTETLLGVGAPGDEKSQEGISMLNEPGGLCVSEDGQSLFIADTNNFCIKKYNLEDKEISQIKLHFSDSSDEIQTQDEVDAKEKVTVPLPPSKVDVTLTLILDLPPILHLTPDAPQAYSLAFKGGISANEVKGTLSNNTLIDFTVDLTEEETAEMSVSSKLFVCSDEGVCTIKMVQSVVKFIREENKTFVHEEQTTEKENQKNTFQISLYIKPVL